MRPEISLSENSIMAHRTKAQWFLPPQGIPKRENGKTDYPLVNTRFSSVPKNEHETQLLGVLAQQRIKDSLKLADEKQKHQTEEQKKQAFIRKYGQRYGSLIYQGKLELGMTQQMCQEVIDIKSYDIGKSMRSGHRVETWTFNKDKQDMQVAAAMTQLSGEEAMALALLMGFADSVGASTPKYSILVFTDGKLTSLY